MCKVPVLGEITVEKVKNIGWICIVVFSLCGFIQTLLGLSPRVSNVEERVAACEKRATTVETRVSGIEIKLDALLHQSEESGKDIKDIYHLIMERHK